MTAVNSTSGSPFADIGLGPPVSSDPRTALGQDDFLRLMLTQFQNQNPLEPVENTEFLGQLAQFSVVSGVEQLQSSLENLSGSLMSDQALQASGLIGREVLVPATALPLEEGGTVAGAVEVPRSGRVEVEILDAAGAHVRTIDLGDQPLGLSDFTWDGCNDAGEAMAAGSYTIKARTVGTETTSLNTFARARVDSVSLGGASGLFLNLDGVGTVPFGSVWRIQ